MVLALPLALLFLIFGAIASPWIVRYLGRIDISTDGILRAVSAERLASREGVPVAIVDIDAQTWKLWGEPAATPRAELASIVANLLRPGPGSSPLAIVMDIDLGTPQEPDGLLPFLERYPVDAPPIVFPKRLEVAADGARSPAPGHYDAVFQGRDNLVWADAMLDSDDDGVVRHWSLWREVCTDGGTEILPSIPARLAALVSAADGGGLLPRPDPPRLSGDCRGIAEVQHRPRLLVTSVAGLRGVAGRGTTIVTPRFASVPARLVADSDAHRDDAALFGGRVVFIGASHPASRDFHRTAYGNLPGVEILAQQVFLGQLSGLRGASYGWGFRLATLAVFALLLAADLLMKRFRIATQLVILVALATGAIRWFGTFTVFEVIIVAISLMVVLAGTRKLWELVREWFAAQRKLDYFFSIPGRKE
ncbi:MAG: CHASE2 domain-containing protein [Burkholderiaceae bacterium]|nr:CHASE2 domain-containing protein [Burkholderiaceae bacterium]